MKAFKTCGCGASWPDRESFLSDPAIKITAFQADLMHPGKGYYLFNHLAEHGGCNSTIAMDVEDFADLYAESVSEHFAFQTDECEGHCARIDDLATCSACCRNAPVREVANRIKDWPKT